MGFISGINYLKEKYFFFQIVNLLASYLVGAAYVFSSYVKVKGERFAIESGEFLPISSPFHLFETLYRAQPYWQFIGICQMLGGFFLLTQRFSKVGVLLSLPIALNIFFITISYEFGGTEVITFFMLLGVVYLFFWHIDSFAYILLDKPLILRNKLKSVIDRPYWAYLGFLYFILSLLSRIYLKSFLILLISFVFSAFLFFGSVIYLFRKNER